MKCKSKRNFDLQSIGGENEQHWHSNICIRTHPGKGNDFDVDAANRT